MNIKQYLRLKFGLVRVKIEEFDLGDFDHVKNIRASVDGRMAVQCPDIRSPSYGMFWEDNGTSVEYEISQLVKSQISAIRYAKYRQGGGDNVLTGGE